jgi:hypothetical protein
MHITYRRAVVAVALLAGIGFALRPLWRVPNGAHFSAPHQNGIRSFVSRIELNSRAPELAIRILHAVAPTIVYACDGTPPCDENQECTSYRCVLCAQPAVCRVGVRHRWGPEPVPDVYW